MSKFRFNIGTGNFRHFIVVADSIDQAKERFIKASEHFPPITGGFKINDVSSIEQLEEEDGI
jgi:hypothetical protein